MKRTLIIILTLIVATGAFAQMKRMAGPGGGPTHGGPGRGGHLEKFLDLTADQKAQWDTLNEQLRATTEPLHQQLATIHEQVQTLLSASTPDATAIGNQLIAAKALQAKIQAAHQATIEKMAAVLTPDQKAKFEEFNSHLKMRSPGGPGFGPGFGMHGDCGQ